MIKIFSAILFLLVNTIIYGQTDNRASFKESCLNSEYADKTEILNKVVGYDFSNILKFDKYNYDVVIRGYIGSNYQRIQVHFISIIKNSENPSQYYVYGKTKVKNNICDFQGTIDLINSRYYKESDIDTIKQGFILAKYKFFEDPNQKYSGYFEGFLKSDWYITDNGFLCYDDLSIIADGYANNEFVGIWNSYNNNASKICNWAHGRIPYSNNLDIGAGEFYPDKQYQKNGWDSYMTEYNEFVTTRKKVEWWK